MSQLWQLRYLSRIREPRKLLELQKSDESLQGCTLPYIIYDVQCDQIFRSCVKDLRQIENGVQPLQDYKSLAGMCLMHWIALRCTVRSFLASVGGSRHPTILLFSLATITGHDSTLPPVLPSRFSPLFLQLYVAYHQNFQGVREE